MATISARVSDVTLRRNQALLGQLAERSVLSRTRTLINSPAQAKQVTTLTMSGASNSTTYTITVNGVDISYTTDSSTSTTELAAGLAAAVNAEPLVRGQVIATSASAVLTLTGANFGVAFTVTESESDIGTPSTTTAAASASAVGFGLAMIQTGYAADPAEANQVGRVATNAAFSAQVDTWTITYVASARVGLSVTLSNGKTYEAHTVSATARADTMTALAAALNAILPANTVLAAGTATGVTLTAEVVGESFESGFLISDEGATDPTGTLSSTKSASTSLALAFAGVSLRTYDVQATTVGDSSSASYGANEGVLTLESGKVWVANSQGVSFGDPVYVELDSGGSFGRFYNTASSTRALLPSARWERDERSGATNDLAVIAFDLASIRAAA